MVQKKKEVCAAFGKRVRKLRLSQNWSQEELAEYAGVHRTYIGMIERGEKNLTLKNIAKLARAFRINISKLFHDI